MNIGISLLGVTRELGGNYQYALTMLESLMRFSNEHPLFVYYEGGLLEVQNYRRTNVILRRVCVDSTHWVYLRRLCRLFKVFGISIFPTFTLGRYTAFSQDHLAVLFQPYWGSPGLLTDIPAIVTIHDVAPKEIPELLGKHTTFSLHFLIEMLVAKARAVLVDSQNGKDLLIRHYQVAGNKIYIIPVGPPTYISSAETSNKGKDQTILSTYELKPGFYFLPAGKYDKYKNIERVLRAYYLVRKKYNIHNQLVFCGNKGAERTSRAFLGKLGLDGVVRFLGYVPDEHMPVLYRHAVALVFPVLLGPTSIPIWEAMSLGCPVIASNISGYREQVGDAGLLVDPYSIEAIADAMHCVSSNFTVRSTLSKRGKEQVAKLLKVDYGKQLIKIAEQIVRNNEA